MSAPTRLISPDLDPLSHEAELARILALPRRAVIDCERGEDRMWAPEAEALVQVETAKYTRGPRLSCGCRDRHLITHAGGDLTIFPEGAPGTPPPPPIATTIDDFLADSAHDEEACEAASSMRPGDEITIRGLGRPCITSLKPVQAWLLRELPRAGGIFGFLPIGSGKSLSSILAPLAVRGSVRTAVLLAKSDQRHHYVQHYRHAREHFIVPTLVMDRASGRRPFTVPGMPVLHFLAYSTLQDQRSTTLLEDLRPDMIEADEAHSLAAAPGARRGAGSARAARVLRYLKARNAEGSPVIFCVWSGSLVNKSLLDMTHLSAHALGVSSPYPIPQEVAAKWADVVDPGKMTDRTSSVAASLRESFGDPALRGSIAALVGDGGILNGIQRRAVETAGVISARSSSVSASLVIRERKLPKMPAKIREALEQVRGYMRPDGDLIVEEVKRIAIARNVALGFYPYWAFPGQPCTCDGGPRKCPRCLRIDDWYAKRKAFGRELRAKLIAAEPHLDSKRLCCNAAERAFQQPPYTGSLPVWPEPTWPPWAAVEHTVKHEKRDKWIDEYAAEDAAKWATEHRGVVWYESVTFGERVAKLAGINCHGGGKDAEAKILAEDGKRSICASISSHSEGRDGLQFKFHQQLVAEPPASGKGWDQLLGRLLREGQEKDEVETWVYLPIQETRDAMRRAITYAEFDQELAPVRSALAEATSGRSTVRGALSFADVDIDL